MISRWWVLCNELVWSKGPWEGNAARPKVSCGKVELEPPQVWPAHPMLPLQRLTETFIKFHMEEAEDGDR